MIDHERALLSTIVQDPAWTLKHASQLSPSLFHDEQCRLVFEAVTECGANWDIIQITSMLRLRGNLDKVGGPAGVSEFINHWIGSHNAAWHLDIVRQSSILRRTLKAHQEAQARLETALTQGTEDAAALLSTIREELDLAGKLPGKRLQRMTSAEAMERAVDEIEERAKNPGQIRGITTGFPTIDKITHGMQKGHLWVVAGGPGDGKSALMQNLLEAAAATGCQNSVYQLEMAIEEQALRFLASDSMTDSGNFLTGMMTYEEQSALMASVLRLKKWGTTFVDTDNASAEDILADIEASDDRVVMVDYLQLMDVTQAKNESRELAISRVAKDLKRLAKRKGITILTGSQLNDDGKLRESRAIGQHADKVLYVNRVEVDGEIDMTRRTLLIGKNRGGKPMEKILLGFAGASFRFTEIGPDDAGPDWTETMPETMPAKRRRK